MFIEYPTNLNKLVKKRMSAIQFHATITRQQKSPLEPMETAESQSLMTRGDQ